MSDDYVSINFVAYGGDGGNYDTSAPASWNTSYDSWVSAVAAAAGGSGGGGAAPGSVAAPPPTISDPNTGRIPPDVQVTYQTNMSVQLQTGTPAQILASIASLEATNAYNGRNYHDGFATGSLIIPGGYVVHFASNAAMENYLTRSLLPIVPYADVAATVQNVLARPATSQDIATAEAGFYAGKAPGDLRSTLAHSAEASSDIGALYQSELGRAASASELAAGETSLAGGGSLAGLRGSVASLPEADTALSTLYQDVTGHPISTETLQALRGQLEQPGESLETVRARVAFSDGKAAVDGLYLWKLGRTADPGGEAGWQANLAAGTTVSDAAVEFARSDEAASTIGSLYSSLTGQAAMPDQVAQYQAMLEQPWVGMQDVRTAIAASSDVIGAVSNFGTTMLGGATLSSATIQRCEQEMIQPGASLADMRMTIAASPEAIAAVSNLGTAMLGGATLSAATIQVCEQEMLAPGVNLEDTRSVIAGSSEAIAAVQSYGSAMLGTATMSGDSISQTLSADTIQQGQEALLAPGANLDATRAVIAASPDAIAAVSNLGSIMLGGATLSGDTIQQGQQALLESGANLDATRSVIAGSTEAIAAVQSYGSAMLGGATLSPDTIRQGEEALLAPGANLDATRMTIALSQDGQAVIANLYQQELGRVADPSELPGWQNTLGSYMTLAQVRASIADSDEAKSYINAAYQGACGQSPSQDAVQCAQALLTLGVPMPNVQASLVSAGSSVAAQANGASDVEPHGLLYSYLQTAWTNIQATGNSIGSGVSDAAASVADGVLNLVQDFVNDPAGTASEVAASLGPVGAELSTAGGVVADVVAGLRSGLTLLGSSAPASDASIEAERQRLVDLIQQRSLSGEQPLGPALSTSDILSPNGIPVGTVYPGATPNIRTVSFSEFQSIKDQLLQGATTLDKPSYPGTWYGRSDGTAFGLRTSSENGLTIDVSDPRLPSDFKVHQQ